MLLWLMNLDFAGGGTPVEAVSPPFFSGGWLEGADPLRKPEKKHKKRRLPELPPEEIKKALETLQDFKIPVEAEQLQVLAVVAEALEEQKDQPVEAAITALQLIEDELVAMMLLGIDTPTHDKELTLAEFMLLLM